MDTYVITSLCLGTCDTACVEVCPVDCIHGPISVEKLRSVPAEKRGAAFPDTQLFIDPDECIGCGACLPECPVEAIFDLPDVPEDHQTDIERNAAFFDRAT